MIVPERLKEKRALECATEVFTRYGYARTTMGDIAAKAGMSRPALYLLFPDKETVFDRVIRAMDMRKLAEIHTLTSKISDQRKKLTAACLSWGLHAVEVAAAHPGRDYRTCDCHGTPKNVIPAGRSVASGVVSGF